MTGGRRLWLQVLKALVRTVGRASDGIRLCLEEGLTSGATLDYVYRNEPSGRFLLGRALDRVFLANPAWEAARVRRRHLEQLMREAIEALRHTGRPISILDIASGPAGYVLAVLQAVGEDGVVARCRDLDPRWLEQGRREAARLGVRSAQFERGDALSRDELLAVRPRPTLVVASGFYDLLTDDEAVRQSMGTVHDALQPGGYFVCTHQVAHPNLEMVSAVFTDFTHQPLRMVMRAPAQIRMWLEAAGFRADRTLLDRWGYCSVTRVQKP